MDPNWQNYYSILYESHFAPFYIRTFYSFSQSTLSPGYLFFLSLFSCSRGQEDERPWEWGCFSVTRKVLNYFKTSVNTYSTLQFKTKWSCNVTWSVIIYLLLKASCWWKALQYSQNKMLAFKWKKRSEWLKLVLYLLLSWFTLL